MHFYFHTNFQVKYHGINAPTEAKMIFVWNRFHDSWLLISFINIPLHQLWRGCDVFSSKHIFTLSSFLISISFASTRLLSYLSEAGVKAEAWGKTQLEQNTCFSQSWPEPRSRAGAWPSPAGAGPRRCLVTAACSPGDTPHTTLQQTFNKNSHPAASNSPFCSQQYSPQWPTRPLPQCNLWTIKRRGIKLQGNIFSVLNLHFLVHKASCCPFAGLGALLDNTFSRVSEFHPLWCCCSGPLKKDSVSRGPGAAASQRSLGLALTRLAAKSRTRVDTN